MPDFNLNSRGTCAGCRFCRGRWLELWDAAVAEHAVARVALRLFPGSPGWSPLFDFGCGLFADYGDRMGALRLAGWDLEGPAGVGAGL